MPFLLDEVENKLNEALQGNSLESLEIHELDCKSLVANSFFDYIASLYLSDTSFKKLILRDIKH